MKALLRFVLKQPWVLNVLKAIYFKFFTEISALRNSNPDVLEIQTMRAQASAEQGLRINLLLPGLSLRHTFGGISTALEILQGFQHISANLRIIVTDESALPKGEEQRFPGWTVRDWSDNDGWGQTIVLAQDRESTNLKVGPNDVFIATAWWTAHIATEVVQQQAQLHGQAVRPFIYLIQDFEPGFYPWSARYMLADATYKDRSRYVPVFNTRLLRDYFVEMAYPVDQALWFNPVFNAGIKQRLTQSSKARERRMLVYGRPSVERNAFPLIVMALRALVARHAVEDWTFVSAGEPHAPVDLGKGSQLVARGKLSLDEYADELGRCHTGFSLMVSAHPSYPPLEMAAAGVRVVTNGYGPKDLSNWSGRIVSVADPQPEQLAQALWQQMQAHGPVEDGLALAQSPEFDQYLHQAMDFAVLADAAFEQVHANR